MFTRFGSTRLLAVVLASTTAVLSGTGLRWAEQDPPYDPLALARASAGQIDNREATVPAQCYTKTAGIANPCWTCHTDPASPNHMSDWNLQEEYAFSDFALQNRWSNLFADRSAAIEEISDAAALEWVRTDNYGPLVDALAEAEDYPGYRPDLDFDAGFDADGFAVDGSGWRAIRYKPFPGTFWPTNGATDDVMIRLPAAFRTDADGEPAIELYRVNLAILEAVIAIPPERDSDRFDLPTDPLDEIAAGVDLDGDGELGTARRITKLPEHYVGGARDIATRRYLYPHGTEFLHTVRYIDPDEPTLLSRRMKEVRYSRKIRYLDDWGRLRAFEHEVENKERGRLPIFAGDPLVGLVNDFGWQLQGFIEDQDGRLRLQTHEEHLACMGCHGAIGVTVDNTFAFARKVPGPAGWAHQDPRGISDVPQAGHPEPEILTWFRRVGGGDEYRANREILERFFADGQLDEAEVRRAAPGGDCDITHLLAPSRERALALNKAYMALVAEQAFELGRDVVLGAIENVHQSIENGETDLAETGRVYLDGRLWLDWSR